MVSKWAHLKSDAVHLRSNGASIRDIEIQLGIARSTLSSWLRNVPLSQKHKQRLKRRHVHALARARKRAAQWHRTQKTQRIEDARLYAHNFLSKLDSEDTSHLEIALAFLYLGEGSKKAVATSLGSSDPKILQFFVTALQILYDISPVNMKGELHLRADQNPDAEIRYWSLILHIPQANFCKPMRDKRTVGSPTFPNYHGVCTIRCAPVAIQRRLMYIATMFCAKSAKQKGG